MPLLRKLKLTMFILLGVLGVLIFQFFKISHQQMADRNNYLKEKSIGNLSRFLAASKEKDFVVFWNESAPAVDRRQKSIPLSELTVTHLRQYNGKNELMVNFQKLEKFLKELSGQIKKESVNAKLQFDPTTNRIKEFSPPQNGQYLAVKETAAKIAANLAKAQLTASLVVTEVPPEVTQNSLAKLGLTALLAKGESDFQGSTKSRIHNIEVGAAKINGLLLKPGEEFSFNKNLGEVDEKQGYRAELVIKSGKLIPEFGGGICQVSTTLFRAAAISGLPILERHPHSFPVRYYNPQGFDATIYPGVSDLRFKNDTNGNILIQNHIEGAKLIFEIFGSDDGRQIKLTGPKILEQNGNGSMKTVLIRKIAAADGTVKEESFWSNYKSPASFPLERNPLE